MDDEAPKPPRARTQRDSRPREDASRGDKAGGKPFKRAAPRPAAVAEEGERIAKRLARAGVASRREAEALIADGRIRVNGQVLNSPAFNVAAEDRIELDGQPVPVPERTRLFLLHKPAGVVTTSRDPEGRRTVFDVLPEGLPRLITVGRLDINTEGLLLLTNDGGVARILELPATGWLRRYRVRVHGEVDEERLKGLAEGIALDGVFYGAIEASLERRQGSNAWLSIALREGKNREVKNVLGSLGLEVTRLIRVSFGPFQLADLPEGHVQEIKGRTLRDQLGERLIAESGADFESEIDKPFSNKPVRREAPREAKRDEGPRERVSRAEIDAAGEGGLIRKPRRDRSDRRGDALNRLQTSRPAPRRDEPARPRNANVWMGPGARPEGKPKPAEKGEVAGRHGPRRHGQDAAGGERRFKPREEHGKPRQFRDERGSAERSAGPEKPRAFGAAHRGEARSAARPDQGGRHRPRPEGGSDSRPPRGDRAEGDRPRKPQPEGDRFGADRPPREARPKSARPRADRPRAGSPEGKTGEGGPPWRQRPDRSGPAADRPRGKAPARDRPNAPDGAPRGGRPFKPRGEGRPGGGRPGGPGGKPRGGPKSR